MLSRSVLVGIVTLAFLIPVAGGEDARMTTSTLKDAFRSRFLVGAALAPAVFTGRAAMEQQMVARQMSAISPENVLKWAPTHPRPDTYLFDSADAYVEFGETHGMAIHGHVLVWHNQTPDWVFEGADGAVASREMLLERMRDHIHTVVGRYRGRIASWDVVNEAILDDGAMRKSKWYEILGDDCIYKAFEFAREADPDALLFYNDYSMTNPRKVDRVARLVGEIRARGLKIDGVGMQGHWSLRGPSLEAIERSIVALSSTGVQIGISELDIDVLPRPKKSHGANVADKRKYDFAFDPYRDGLPDAVQEKLAQRYADVFRVFLKHSDKIRFVTFWGTTDRYSWKNNFPMRGRTNHALLFDREANPKPAFHRVIEVAP